MLNIIAKYFIERLEYRAALHFIEIIRKQPKDDLQGIILSLELYSKLGREDKVKNLITMAERIISKEPYNRFIKNYQSCKVAIRVKKAPIENDLSGTIEIINSNLIFIKGQDGKKMKVKEKKKMSKNIKHLDKVFYSTYYGNMIEADFIEPFFQSEAEILAIFE